MFRKLLTTFAGLLTEMSLTNSWPQRRNPLQALMGCRIASSDVREDSVRGFCLTCWRAALFLSILPKVELSLTPKSSDIDYNGRILGSYIWPSGKLASTTSATWPQSTLNSVSRFGAVRRCTSLELFHQRSHYLYDALHRTNYAGQCQSRTVHGVRLPSTKDFEEIVPEVHGLREMGHAISLPAKTSSLCSVFAFPPLASLLSCCSLSASSFSKVLLRRQ